MITSSVSHAKRRRFEMAISDESEEEPVLGHRVRHERKLTRGR